MTVLVWKHATTAIAARQTLQAELRNLGYDSKVTWKGDEAAASVGWGSVLSASGKVTEEAIVLDKCGGALGGMVLGKCREILARIFPNGKEA